MALVLFGEVADFGLFVFGGMVLEKASLPDRTRSSALLYIVVGLGKRWNTELRAVRA